MGRTLFSKKDFAKSGWGQIALLPYNIVKNMCVIFIVTLYVTYCTECAPYKITRSHFLQLSKEMFMFPSFTTSNAHFAHSFCTNYSSSQVER